MRRSAHQASAGQGGRHSSLRTFLQRLSRRPDSESRPDSTSEENTIFEADFKSEAESITPPPACTERTDVSHKQQQDTQAQGTQATDQGCSQCSHCDTSSDGIPVHVRAPQRSPATGVNPRFCAPCQHARRSHGYDERLARLFTPLRCASCHENHPAMFFSKEQRRPYNYSRYCVAKEGHSWLCPHVPLSLAMITRQVKATSTRTYQCKDPMCPSATMVLDPESDNVNVDLNWESTLPLHLASTATITSCFEPMISQLPQILCPHIRRNTDALSSPECGEQSDNRQEMECKICDKEFYCTSRDRDGQRKYGTSHSFQWKGNTKLYDSEWIYVLDPRTFGFFDDPMWKHIAWCDDMTCATSHGLLRLLAVSESPLSSYDANNVLTRPALDAVYKVLLQHLRDC